MPTRNITLIVRAVGSRQAARQIEQTGNAVEKLGHRAAVSSRSLRHMGDIGRTIGRELTHNVTMPIVGIAAAALKTASDFRSSMTMIQAHAGASAKEVADFTKEIRRMSGRELVQSPKELADALFHIRSVGRLPAPINDDYIGVLKAASQLATIGHANIEDTASALAGLFKTQMPGINSIPQAMGEINATVGTGNMRMQDFNDLVSTGVMPVAKEAGLQFRDVAGAVALLTDENWKASRAGTLLRTSFHFLTSPSDRANKAMKRIGVSSATLAEDLQKPQGLRIALQDLKDHLDRLPLAQRNVVKGMIFPTGRGTPMYVLMNQLDNYQAKMDQIGKLAPHWREGLRITMDLPGTKLHKAWSLIQNDLITIGDDLLPPVADAVGYAADKIDDLVSAFDKLSPSTKKWIGIAVGAAAAVGPLVALLGTMGIMLGGIGQLAGGTMGAVGFFLRKMRLVKSPKGTWRGKLGLPGGGVGGMSTGVMNVTARIVNVTGGLGGAGGMPIPGGPNAPKPHVRGKVPQTRRARVLGRAARAATVGGQLVPGANLALDTYLAIHALGLDVGGAHGVNPLTHHPFTRGPVSHRGIVTPRYTGGGVNKGGLNALIAPHGVAANPPMHNLGLTGHLQAGGTVEQPGVYEVGERGSEQLYLPSGATVAPHGQRGEVVIPIVLNIDGRQAATAMHRAVLRKASTR